MSSFILSPSIYTLFKAIYSKMDTLPVELLQQILQHLPLASLKCMRQTSKFWSTLGQPYLLLPTFRTLPHRPSTLHLQEIAHHPFYSSQIKTINFNHGEVNEYSGRHNSYFLHYLMVPEERLTQQHITWDAYSSYRQLTDQYLPQSCDEEVLTDIFSRLPNLNSLSISLMTCPFPPPPQNPNLNSNSNSNPGSKTTNPDLLPEIWAFPSTRLLPRVATVERMTSLTSAISANISTLSISTLSHDRLPFELFFQNASKMDKIAPAFTHLTSLTLYIDYSDLPNDTHATAAFRGLGRCLRAAIGLKVLELAFRGRRKVDVRPLLEDLVEDGFLWEGLERVQFEGVITTADDLGAFLVRHKASLRVVTLGGEGVRAKRQPVNGGMFLEGGSWRALVERLGKEMGECEVFMWGDCKGLESGERWVLEEKREAEEVVGANDAEAMGMQHEVVVNYDDAIYILTDDVG
ncbi:hypothetical protein VTL71DRAFT_7010 [Oculimacula yallundae]|uniref:F-box domain-containing protein n=1 Tax=Oculimacula yallundae TaxID=86028 RepID=A0ABR4BVH3_9HELO